MHTVELGGVEYPVSYNWEAIQGIQTDLGEDSLDGLFKSISKAFNEPEKVKQSDLTAVMKTAKTVIYHGLRGAAFEEDKECPFKTPSHVGARIRSFKVAGKELGLFLQAMHSLFYADPEEDEGKQTGEAVTP